jgi:hypothetical protein
MDVGKTTGEVTLAIKVNHGGTVRVRFILAEQY